MNKLSAFAIGKSAAARAGNCSPRYVCPLCLTSFYDFDPKVLTEEHVPARSLGGKGLVLTCSNCNNRDGAALQGHQKSKNRVEKFWAGKLDTPLNIEVFTEHGTLRGEAKFTGKGSVKVALQNKRMNPRETETLTRNSEDLQYDSYKLGHGFNHKKALIVDLRDAYLWVFARYGYRAIATPWMDWARQAIREGSSTVTKWAIHLTDYETKRWQDQAEGPVICWLEDPHAALLVCNGQSGVILPSVFNPAPYNSLSTDSPNFLPSTRIERVPTEMIMGMDFSDAFSRGNS